MSSPVIRSFSPFGESDESGSDYKRFSLGFFSADHKGLSWSDLLRKRLVVIVGEAGIGKTFEFKNEAETLASEGQAAFLLPLNLLDTPEGFDQALINQRERYDRWVESNDTGYFFLDAVDEARLNSHIAFDKALINVRRALLHRLKRVSFYLSSRITDWSLPSVQEIVRENLLKPLNAAQAPSMPVEGAPVKPDPTRATEAPDAIDLEVFSLDPLSVGDAKTLAEAFGVKEVESFWQQVEEGGYEFLATRPLDLQWLAARWREAHILGAYSELLEAGVNHRLTEKNQSYVDAGAVRSRAQLRDGAERLAAASVFSGLAYVQVGQGEPFAGAVVPTDVLPDWTPLEHLRLLGAAVFDEATFGRVKFHHRTVREYLAACWVEKQIAAGLPEPQALSLFVQSPYGKPVLLDNRRSTLCWLAAMNAKVRQRIILQFPEMLMFDGDPQRWSSEDVVEAFKGYIKKLESGYKSDWWSVSSEVRRVARLIPPQLLAEYLHRYARRPEVFAKLLPLVKHGKVEACADTVFSVYRNTASSKRERRYLLSTLSSVASPDHKAVITDDLLSGTLNANELIAAGLEVVGVEN